MRYLQSLFPSLKNKQSKPITTADIIFAQKAWAQGIVEIGKEYSNNKDYKKRTKKHLNDLYAFKISPVLFKPTLASTVHFRQTFDQTLSYFIGGIIKEDHGFALKPWRKVKFCDQRTVINEHCAVAMGGYEFTTENNETTSADFTFVYIQGPDNRLLINVHHSSLPFV